MASPGRRGLPPRGGEIRMLKDHAEVIRLRAAGHSYRAIARMTGYHYSTVWSIVRQHLAELAPAQEDIDRIQRDTFRRARGDQRSTAPIRSRKRRRGGQYAPP